jgi:large subunit ribosomal protein L7/L12
MADFPAAITELGDKIANLKLSEAALLKDYLKEKYKIEPAAGAPVVVGPGPVGPGPGPGPEPVKTEFTVMLEGLADPAKKIQVIKVVREITSCGLAEGKTMVESAPKPIKENLSKEEAEAVKKKLEEAGAKVSLK